MQETDLTVAAEKARILIVDDHPLVRAGLRALIGGESDLEVCGEAEGIAQTLTLAQATGPRVVIIDLSLSDGSGLELIKRLHRRHPELLILVCSMHEESLFAERALRAGARGYVNKHEATDRVVEAIRQVLSGGVYLSPTMTQRLLLGVTGGTGSARTDDWPPLADLSDRELEVFGLIGAGLGTTQIAERLCLSVKTVETHREKLKRKLNLVSGAELARRAVQWQLEQAASAGRPDPKHSLGKGQECP
jgi:DNA-binding NarL/FixJ family response regulator